MAGFFVGQIKKADRNADGKAVNVALAARKG
jgi:hypothetical protein